MAVLAGAAALGCAPTAAAPAPKPPEVDTAEVVLQDVTDYEVFTGSVQAEQYVDLRAQVTGYLLPKPLAKEGSDVKAGAVLFRIDPSVFDAVLAQAKANTNSANTRVQTANDTYVRDAASPAATTAQTLVQDRDALREAQAALKAAQAMEQSAQLNVNFTDIIAPFDGRISRRNVDPGNLVQQNITSLATVVQLDPIYALFDVDERTLLRIRKLVQEKMIPAASLKGNDLSVNLALSDENGFTYTPEDEGRDYRDKAWAPRHPGKIKIVDNQENVQTGTLRMWGEFPNPEPRVLSPGMFARIQLPIGTAHSAVLVAEAALVSDQGRQLLYVLEDAKNDKGEPILEDAKNAKGEPIKVPAKMTVARNVTIGGYHEGLREIVASVAGKPLPANQTVRPGEQVVLNGLQRVRDKGLVRVRHVIEMPRGDENAETITTNEQGGKK